MIRTCYSDELKEGHVKVAGFVREVRSIGKIIFIELEDKKGSIQLTVKNGNPVFDSS